MHGIWATGAAVLIAASQVQASELVYRPVNPAFGGHPLNGFFLLDTARAQSDHHAGDLRSIRRPGDVQGRFDSRFLGRVSDEVAAFIFGEAAVNAGSFRVDGAAVDFQRIDRVVVLNIRDESTGEATVIRIPTPSF